MEFVRRADSGRTSPVILSCEDASAEQLELFCKTSGGCDQGVTSLAYEAIAACLASDLGLPIPKPYLVEIIPQFADGISQDAVRNRFITSARICFGSTRAPSQFSVWQKSDRIYPEMVQTAASILLFDAIIQNPDRRDENPNCLKRGNELRIIDHELCFATKLILNWQPPWGLGGMDAIGVPGAHIFFRALRGVEIDFGPISDAWQGLSDQRIDSYVTSIPQAWYDGLQDVRDALELIKQARDQVDDCIAEIRRVLT